MTVAGAAQANFAWILLGTGILVGGFWYWLRREGSPVLLDRILLRLPYFGGLMRMYATSQLMRTPGAQLRQGQVRPR